MRYFRSKRLKKKLNSKANTKFYPAWLFESDEKRDKRRQKKDTSLAASQSEETTTSDESQQQPDQEGDEKKKKKHYYKRHSNKPRTLFRAERVLANRSGKSRAECHKLLKNYAVSIVEGDDGEAQDDTTKFRVIAAKERIPMTARLFINQKFEVPSVPPLLMVYHKPKWILSTMGDDARQRRNLQNLKFAFSQQMHPVGRLDYDTSGLLLFSSSGQLTQQLLHPKYDKEKEYRAVVTGTVEEEALRKRLQEGVELADVQSRRRSKQGDGAEETTEDNRETLTTRADLLEVEHWPAKDVKGYLNTIRATLPPEYNVTDLNMRGYMDVFEAQELSEIRLVVTEGKHRMVRRLLASCGHAVVSLKRERMGVIELGDLPEGAFRNTTDQEEAWAESMVKSRK